MSELALKKRNSDRIDYGFLQGVVPYNVMPSDLDGFLALKNGTLFLEWKKPQEVKLMKKGQKKALQNLAKNNTVWILLGESNPDKFYIMEFYRVLPDGEKFAEKIGYGVKEFKKQYAVFFWENN